MSEQKIYLLTMRIAQYILYSGFHLIRTAYLLIKGWYRYGMEQGWIFASLSEII